MGLLEGRTSIITGAAQGIGFAMAEAFAAEGSRVVIGDLDASAAERAAKAITGGAIGVGCDVADAGDIEALINVAIASFGSVDVFVNNAGITRDATMRKMTEAQFDAVVSVHLKGTWLGTRAASAVMRDQESGGSIINMSSISGKVGLLGQTNYSAAKAGIVGLTKAAAKEVGFAGVRVNAIQPGLIRTPMTEGMRADILATRLAEIPLGRMGEPAEVAQVALFLASDMSRYVTGAVLEVTGGRHM
ncbi:MAG: 3-oxoacyl-ACP reductase FabG [Microbacterium sp.]|jgi:3-oxoacyl-[acyl-carrier protein] reductase|uniref:3-oxoacyl-ACP reductase FabG n=1 Tax=Microbacterium sp. TaxID=51671 RepID=UPI0027216C52|nr:3-oxoacyl-ACP reductase FabG [Microbacterium sp.]MDO8381485.1 3-oxoacyl-ACP reductase FabG [Microbacterium sp.]